MPHIANSIVYGHIPYEGLGNISSNIHHAVKVCYKVVLLYACTGYVVNSVIFGVYTYVGKENFQPVVW